MECRIYNIHRILKEYDRTKSVHHNMNKSLNSVWVYSKEVNNGN